MEETRYCANVSNNEALPPIFTMLLADFYGLPAMPPATTGGGLTPEQANQLKVAAEATKNTQAGVSFLVHDRKGKQARNRKRGKENHEKAMLDDAERQRAAHDVQTALKRVADDPDVKKGKHGAILAACRRVCSRFATLTDAKKNAPTFLPLTQADGKPLKPETLARYYREKYKAKRGKK